MPGSVVCALLMCVPMNNSGCVLISMLMVGVQFVLPDQNCKPLTMHSMHSNGFWTSQVDKAESLHLHSEAKLCRKVFQGNTLALFYVLHKLPHQALHCSKTSTSLYLLSYRSSNIRSCWLLYTSQLPSKAAQVLGICLDATRQKRELTMSHIAQLNYSS